ncbi:MAG: nicotinate-nucleotide diphosphorylase, partial [Planctomycetota bacterium]
CGGGTLHRIGLFDAVMYKDNHLAGLRGTTLTTRLEKAARRARTATPLRYVAVEADDLEQLECILSLSAGLVDIVLLDNMPLEMLRRAVDLRDQRRSAVLLEASGGVTLETVRAIAETGVDRISVGAITHSAPAMDVGLDFLE